MAEVRDLRDFYKTVMKKNNEKSEINQSSVNQAEISIITNKIKSYTQPWKNYNTSVSECFKIEVGDQILR